MAEQPALGFAALLRQLRTEARLTLHEADGFNQPGPSGTVPYWTVSDVDGTVAQWSEHGASAHRGPKTIMTGERLCQVLDPFGNLFGLRQPPA